LPKWITAALREIDYLEDRGASAIEACQGTFKYQHDTGKNEKYVHVFPRVARSASDGAGGDDANSETEAAEEGLSGAEKAEKICIESSLETFALVCNDKMKPWVCKKRVSALLQDALDKLGGIEEKLTRLVKLDAAEQKLFDAADRDVIAKKIDWLRAEMISMVDDLHLTKAEAAQALAQVKAKLAELETAKDTPAARLETLRARAARVEKAIADGAFYRHPLKHESRMKELFGKSLALAPIADKAGSKGRWSSKLSAFCLFGGTVCADTFHACV